MVNRDAVVIAGGAALVGALAIYAWLATWAHLIGMRWLEIHEFAKAHLGIDTRQKTIAFAYVVDMAAAALPFILIGCVAGWFLQQRRWTIVGFFLLGVVTPVLIDLGRLGMLAAVPGFVAKPLFWAGPLVAVACFLGIGRVRRHAMDRRVTFLLLVITLMASVAQPGYAQSQRQRNMTSGSSVEIERIDPGIGTVLVPGNRVTITVKLRYTLTSASGMVSLFIQGPDPSSGLFKSVDKRISKGSDTITLTTDIEVPKARHVDVILALYDSIDRSTTITDSRVYEVLRQ